MRRTRSLSVSVAGFKRLTREVEGSSLFSEIIIDRCEQNLLKEVHADETIISCCITGVVRLLWRLGIQPFVHHFQFFSRASRRIGTFAALT